MKTNYFLVLFAITIASFSQTNTQLSTIEAVTVLNDNEMEAFYYYNNNWKILREKAVKENYIASYDLLKVKFNEETPFHLILVTTYANKRQHAQGEANFEKLINGMGKLKLLNNKKPSEFRRSYYVLEHVEHLK